MSELHFDAEGEPAKVPGDAEELRVRRFRKPGERGACEVVHGADGAPLYVPADASYLEFRKLIDGVPGRYRLDPVDASRRLITSAVPLYVTIEAVRNGGSAGAADSVTVELLRANVEMMRANVEMTKHVTERLASMMTATAEILRAADGAGLPRREPPPAPLPPLPTMRNDGDDQEDDEDDDDDQDDGGAGMGPLVATLTQLAEQAFPLFEAYVVDRMAARRRAETGAAPVAAASAPEVAPVVVAEPVVAAPVVPAPVVAAAPAVAPVVATAPVVVATPTAAPAVAPEAVRNAAEPDAPSPEQLQHLIAVKAKLAPMERKVVMAAIPRMESTVRAQLLTELCSLPVDEAAELVRSLLPPLRSGKERQS